jgi:hypothetical protein
LKSEILKLLESYGAVQASNGIALPSLPIKPMEFTGMLLFFFFFFFFCLGPVS